MFNIARCCALAAATGLALLATGANAGAPTPGGFAVVDADGKLHAHANVLRVKHANTGVYRVIFDQDVSACAANATIAARNGKSIIPGYIVVGHGAKTPNEVRVFTFLTATLLPADYKFNLAMACGT